MPDSRDAPQPLLTAAGAHFLEDALVNLSHELRTPLAAAKGFTTSLLHHDRRLTRTERVEMLNEINLACNRMEAVIDRTLATARLLHGDVTFQPHPTDLAALTRTALEAVTRARDADICTFAVTLSAPTLPMVGDATLLLQTLIHLLDNACKYSSPGSIITVVARSEATAEAQWLEWSVADQGMGIAPHHLPYIFTPFYQAEPPSREVGGLGLGLAFCQHVLALHGSALQVHSVPGVGSRFWFTLHGM